MCPARFLILNQAQAGHSPLWMAGLLSPPLPVCRCLVGMLSLCGGGGPRFPEQSVQRRIRTGAESWLPAARLGHTSCPDFSSLGSNTTR